MTKLVTVPQGADAAAADARRVIEDEQLDVKQRVYRLAQVAENLLAPPAVSTACSEAMAAGVVCDMFEGHAPHRPRYLLVDFQRALRSGSDHLELEPPGDLPDALAFLLMLYQHVPSITGYPVWLGDIDRLLEPYTEGVTPEQLHRELRRFWVMVDRMLPDAFVHANLGPDDGRVVRTALAVHRELRQVVPNLSLRVDPQRTPDSLVLDAIATVFASAQPHFVNHPALVSDLGEHHGIVSCYNSLLVGGGAHTLVRLNLAHAVRQNPVRTATFIDEVVPHVVELTAELMEARIRYLVERARFFDTSWLVAEGLVSLERFSAMFGVVGLAEAVSLLMERDGRHGRYGHDTTADELARSLVAAVAAAVRARPMSYCSGSAGRALLHSQAGLDSDEGFTAGTRVPPGDEPPLYRHLQAVGPLHAYFPAGVSDIVQLETTALDNPDAVLDLVRGAFASGMREFTFNVDGNGFVRVTGYLARVADVATIATGARHASTFLAAGALAAAPLLQRTRQRVACAERNPVPG